MEEQPTRESRCPECGADATPESLAEHQLSDLGYLHDDQTFECSECGNEYVHGVPIGGPDVDADDLWCDVCGLGYMSVHRIRPGSPVTLDLKCGHHHAFDCPHCDGDIPADGLATRKGGRLACPRCGEGVERSEAPFCFYWTQTERSGDEKGRVLVGHPPLVGNTAEAGDSYGYE